MVSINSATVFLGGPYQKGLWSVSLICQAWSLSHIRHTNDRQPGAYHALNKRGRIPCVFPHEDTSCSRGRVGFWVSFGNIPRTTLPPPKVLSAHFVFLFFFPSLLSSSFNKFLPPTLLPTPLISPFGLLRLDQKLCDHYCSFLQLSEEMLQS